MLSWRQRKPLVSFKLSTSMANIEAEKPDHSAVESPNSPPRSPITIPRRSIVTEYLRAVSPSFRHLDELRRKVTNCSPLSFFVNFYIQGWENREGDEYFKQQRSAADNASTSDQKRFFRMMQSLGQEIDAATGAFFCPHPNTLDLCMAPGGYSASVLYRHPDATIRGISLPRTLGGHNLRVYHGKMDPRVQVQFMDLTMLASEFGVCLDDIPSGHPEASKFNSVRPFYGQEFDIVICDGQVLRTHHRAEWRVSCEAPRLTVSQLILGLQRIKTGGTLIMLLHKIEAWSTSTLLKTFDAFSSVVVFKPEKKHGQRSSFYLVAKNVQPESEAAKEAVKKWKKTWYATTFEGDSAQEYPNEEAEAAFLEEFGPRLVELGHTIWETQARALERAPYVRSGCSGRTADVDGAIVTGDTHSTYHVHGSRYPWERGFEVAGELQSVQELLRTARLEK
jgi:23S rRNA U2552 (ribose-2'-O)-methylase RlmE/FtsJ